MSTTTSRSWRDGFEQGLAQWPLFAAAWAPHVALLTYIFFTRFPTDELGLAETLFVPAGLLTLAALEVGALVVLAAALESLLPTGRLALALDVVKALGVAAILATLVTSTLKFVATSVHLKVTDLWFAYTNVWQILQEAQLFEAATIVAVPAAAGVGGLGLLWAFRRSRRRPRRLAVRRFVIAMVACALVLVVCAAGSVILPQMIESVVPEGHWMALQRAQTRFLTPTSGVPTIANGARSIEPYEPGVSPEPLNVVLVMLESVPWKRTFLGPEGRPGATPNLERLASESVVFERAYAASTHSDYAQMAILSSLHPRKYNRHDYYIDIEYPRALIWDALQAAGYETSLFSCQNERWGNMLNFLETPGLDVLRHSLNWPNAPKRGRGIESKVYEETPVSEWQRWRRQRVTGPYFTYLNFQSNHFPYDAPTDAPRPYRPFELDFTASFLSYPRAQVPVMLNRFDNALHYADRKIGEIVEFLKEVGDWDSTILVVVSDHGEAFYEHQEPTHGTALYEEQVRSLWLMRVPGGDARRVSQPVALLDVAPALLEALGLPPHGNFQGRGDVLDAGYNGFERPLFFTIQGLTQEDGVLLGGTKLIVNWDRRTKALYDVAADPEERTDLAHQRVDRLRALEQVLGAFLQQQVGYYEERLWTRGYYPAQLP